MLLLCYYISNSIFLLIHFSQKTSSDKRKLSIPLKKNKLWHLIIIRCHSLLSQKLDSIKPLSHPRCVLISGSNDKKFLCACNDAGDYNDFIYTALPHMFFLPFYVCFCCFVLCSWADIHSHSYRYLILIFVVSNYLTILSLLYQICCPVCCLNSIIQYSIVATQGIYLFLQCLHINCW